MPRRDELNASSSRYISLTYLRKDNLYSFFLNVECWFKITLSASKLLEKMEPTRNFNAFHLIRYLMKITVTKY